MTKKNKNNKNTVELLAKLHEAKAENKTISDVAQELKATAAVETTKSTTEKTTKVREDLQKYKFTTIHDNLIRYDTEDDMTAYAKREYLKSYHNDNSVSITNETQKERALSTFYRDVNNNDVLYNRATAYKLVQQYIELAKQRKQDYIVTKEVEQFYRVFGPAISDNTLAIFRKLAKELSLSLIAVKDSEESRRVKFYKLYIV